MTKRTIQILTARSGVIHPNNFHCYYETLARYSDWGNKTSIGKDFICRFCGETDRKQFKKENAHTFPEFTGNKWLFSKDECKKCNEDFSRYENELANHSLIMRTMYGSKTKKNASTKLKNNLFSLQREPDGFKMNVFSENKEKIKPAKDGEITFHIDFEKGEKKAQVKIPEKEYIPLYLFKALNKIAFSIMPEKELDNSGFEEFKKWLRDFDMAFDKDDGQEPYFYIYHNRLEFLERDPMLILFKKQSKYASTNIPTYSFLFAYGNHIFQIFIPFCLNDKWLIEERELKLLIIPEILKEIDGQGNCIWMNGHSANKVKYKDFEFTGISY